MITLSHSRTDLLQRALDRIKDSRSAEAVPLIELVIESLEHEKPAIINSSIPEKLPNSSTKPNTDSIQGVMPLSATSSEVFNHICGYIRKCPVGGRFKYIDVKNHLKYVFGFNFNQKISDKASDQLENLVNNRYLSRLGHKSQTYIVLNKYPISQ